MWSGLGYINHYAMNINTAVDSNSTFTAIAVAAGVIYILFTRERIYAKQKKRVILILVNLLWRQ